MNTQTGYDVQQQRMPRVALEAAGLSDVGHVRARNEDAYLVATLQASMLVHDANVSTSGWFTGSPSGTLLVVADGMGGQGSGDVASHVAVQSIAGYLMNVLPWASSALRARDQLASLPGMREELREAVAMGDTRIRGAAESPGVSHEMGTTLTMAYLVWPILYVAHVGDSRCYLARQGSLFQLTTDHTVAQAMREQGARASELPLAWHHTLWNALGGGGQTPEPQIGKHPLEMEDVLVLCSDGLTKHVSDEEILTEVRTHSAPVEICQRLIGLANARGGTDNTTVLVARPHFAV